MQDITRKGYFTDTGNSDRSTENFQHQVFENIDFTGREVPISFYRSDFRSVRMDHMVFYKNNFDRADVVNAFITDSRFNECKWGTDFMNTVFMRSHFQGNQMDTCTIDNCYFDHCEFIEEQVINTSNRGSTYKNCRFDNCKLEMNSFNEINFIDSSIHKVDISSMGAYDLSFDNCTFSDVTIDPDYLGSYLFKNCLIDQLQYSYRGKDFLLTGDIKKDLGSLALFYKENERYYEAFNTTILFRHYGDASLSVMHHFQNIIKSIYKNPNELVKKDQLNRIIKALIFYADSDLISVDEVFYLIGYFKELDFDFFGLKDKLAFLSNIDLLAKTIESYLFDCGRVRLTTSLSQVYAEIQIEEENLDVFKQSFDSFFKTAMNEYNHEIKVGYHIVGTRKGSLIVEIIGYAVGFYVLAVILKSTVSKLLEIRMEYKLFQKADQFIEDKITDIPEFVRSTPTIRKLMSQPSDELLKKSKPLAQLMKQFHLFPNAVLKRREIK